VKSLFQICCLSLFLVSFWAQHALAEKRTQSQGLESVLTYDVYAGGVHALKASLILKKTPKSYNVFLSAGTQGFLKKMANWSGKYTSVGRIRGDKSMPLIHESSSTWKGKTEVKTFQYDGRGNFKSYSETEEGKKKPAQEIDLSLAKNSTDVLSSTFMLLMTLPKSQICSGNDLIFDGDRNFRLQFKNTKTETLEKTRYNVFAGETISCVVEVKPEQGKWRKKPRGWLSIQEQGRNLGSLPTIWFGQLPDRPDIYVPVKIRVKTEYGTLFMHLTSAKTQ
jgi:hypothetical protein